MDRVLCALSTGAMANDGSPSPAATTTHTSKLFQQTEQQLVAREAGAMRVLERGLDSSDPHQTHLFLLFLDYLLQTDSLSGPIISMIKDHSAFFTTAAHPVPPLQVAKVLLKWHDHGYLELAATKSVVEGVIREGEAVRQARKQFMEMLEKDRDRQRGLREMDWQCSDPETECDAYLAKASRLTDYERLCIAHELDAYHKRTGEREGCAIVDPPATKHSRLRVDLSRLKPSTHGVLVHLPCFDNIVQPQCEQLFRIVCRLARVAFFHDDLRDFNQVHVDYYRSEDDHRDLKRYDFGEDDLGRRRAGRSHYLVERAVRMRKAVDRYDRDPQRCADRLDKAELRQFYAALKEHPELVEACRTIDAVASWGFRVAVAVELHLSLILALFALLNPRRLTAAAFYSLQDRDLDYVQQKVRESMGDRVTLVTCPDDASLVEIKSFLN